MSQIEELPTRWEIELEFVQSLANTQYVVYLAQQGYFNDKSFLNYLNYLNYWKDPKFSKFLVYPNCLHILTLLQNDQFRLELFNQNFTNVLYNDMVESWKEPLFKDEPDQQQHNQIIQKSQSQNQDKGKDTNSSQTKNSNSISIQNLNSNSSISPSSTSVSPYA